MSAFRLRSYSTWEEYHSLNLEFARLGIRPTSGFLCVAFLILLSVIIWMFFQTCHRFDSAGIVNPRFIKSARLPSMPVLEENSVCKLSFGAIFRRLLRSSCSAKTLAVSDAVSSFLIAFDDGTVASPFNGKSGPATTSATAVASPFLLSGAFFLFLPKLGAFFRECVRPVDCSLDSRSRRRSLSADEEGRIGITFSAKYVSLHWQTSAQLVVWEGVRVHSPADIALQAFP